MLEFLAKNLLSNMPLVPTNRLFKTSMGLIIECCGIVRAVPIKIDEIEVFIDFHFFTILEFELLIGHPLDNFFQEKPSHGSLSEELGKTTSATHLDIPMAKQHLPNHDAFKEVKFLCPFVSPKLAYVNERPSSPSLKSKPCPSDHQNVVLDSGRDSMFFLHDISFENKNLCAIDMLLSAPCS